MESATDGPEAVVDGLGVGDILKVAVDGTGVVGGAQAFRLSWIQWRAKMTYVCLSHRDPCSSSNVEVAALNYFTLFTQCSIML